MRFVDPYGADIQPGVDEPDYKLPHWASDLGSKLPPSLRWAWFDIADLWREFPEMVPDVGIDDLIMFEAEDPPSHGTEGG